MTTCPICNSDDSVDCIGSIVYNGVTTTYTDGVSYNPIIAGEPFTVSNFESTTVSPLARALMPLTMPGRPLVAFFGLYIILSGLIWTGGIVAEDPDLHVNPVVAFFAYLLSMPWGLWYGAQLGLVISAVHLLIVVPWIPLWKKKEYHFLNESYYCYRDNVAFDSDVSGAPESFRNYAYFSRKVIS